MINNVAGKGKKQTIVTMGKGTVIVTTVHAPGQASIQLTQSDRGTVGSSADHMPIDVPDVVLDFSEATNVCAIASLETVIDAATKLRDALRTPERRTA